MRQLSEKKNLLWKKHIYMESREVRIILQPSLLLIRTVQKTMSNHAESYGKNWVQEIVSDWTRSCFWKRGVLLTMNAATQLVFIEPLLCAVQGWGVYKDKVKHIAVPVFSALIVQHSLCWRRLWWAGGSDNCSPQEHWGTFHKKEG